jgi:hypothetical protein
MLQWNVKPNKKRRFCILKLFIVKKKLINRVLHYFNFNNFLFLVLTLIFLIFCDFKLQ